MKILINMSLLFLLGFITGPTFAESNPIGRCSTSSISSLAADGIPIATTQLASMILLAREATIYIEFGDVQVQATQNFVNPKSSISCISAPANFAQTFNLLAPTLLNFQDLASNGNSVWQFNISVEGLKVGIWNQVSRLESKTFDWAEWTSSPIRQVIVSQVQHDQFELLVKQKTKNGATAMVILFDAVSNP